jgi:WD40 repeat protein
MGLAESSLQLVSKSATDFMSVKRRASRAAVAFASKSGVAGYARSGWAGSDGGKGRMSISKEMRPDSVQSFASSGVSSRKKIEEMLNLDHMQELRKRFEEADADGNGAIDVEEFKAVFKKLLGRKAKESSSEEQMTALFMKIDFSSDGFIDWDEFCTYMLLEFTEKDDAYHRSVEVLFNLPAVCAFTPHRDTIFRVCHQNNTTFVTASQDGMLAFWSNDLSLKKTFQLPKVTSRGTDAGSQATEASSRGNDTSSRPKKRWVTDVALLTHFNKFVISTGDRELQFYELSTLEPYCHISSLESIPLKLHFWADPSNKNYCLLSFGDGEGCVSTLIFYSLSSCFRQWKKFPRADQTPSVTLDQVAISPDSKLVRWKVHDDWVAELKYFHAIRSVISCSHDPNTAVVVGSVEGSTHVESYLRELSHSPGGRRLNYTQLKHRYDADQTVFKIYKGAKTFDFSAEHNILATGGMDRVLRLWNPYVPSKPIGMLRGHNGPIMKLAICESESRVYTISTDKTVKVWHIQDQSCLTTITEKAHRVAGCLQTMHYNPGCRTLAIVTDVVAVLTLKGKPLVKEKVLSHRDPVQSVQYNSSFKQVLTCCDGSVVKLWELETGVPLFEFSHAHDDEPIVDMVFDSTQRRLITAGQDGTIRSWNFNNGHCLRIFKKDNKQEFTCLTYVNFNNCKRIIGVGWDRRLTMFPDTTDDCHHVQYPLPYWPDDLNFGHQEDILGIAFCPPHYVATSSFDGEVWYCHCIHFPRLCSCSYR